MNKMNTLAFVNFLLIKHFPTLIRQIFRRQKFAPYGISVKECAKVNLPDFLMHDMNSGVDHST